MIVSQKLKRAVSPVIAVVLLIALAVGAAAVIWGITTNFNDVGGTLVITQKPTYSDSPTDPDQLVDKITMTVKNIGAKEVTLQSATLKQATLVSIWDITVPTTDIGAQSETLLTIVAPSTSDQLTAGELLLIVTYGDTSQGVLQEILTIPEAQSYDTYIYAYYANAYQNEGTLTSGNYSSLISSLDSNTAPSVPDGTVTKNYFATGTSGAYYDALALRFNVGTFAPATYTATLRVFIFDGGYSTTWHHYLVQSGETNTSYQNVSPPAVSTAWDDNADNGPDALQIDILLPSWAWSTGDFWITLRLWDAKVDLVQLIMTPNA